MRQVARSITTLFISTCLLVGICVSASAAFTATDPEDNVDGMDFRHVSTEVSHGHIKFTASFHNFIVWQHRARTTFYVDSRGGGGTDRLVRILRKHGPRRAGPLCIVLNQRSMVIDQHLVYAGSNHVSCRVRRALLDPDGSAIRWRVKSHYLKGDAARTSADKAPDFGWLPHV